MTLPKYSEYKASGVEWLGAIPSHWSVSQSRRMFRVRSEPACSDDQMLTASQKYGVLPQAEFMLREGRRVVEVIQGLDSLKHVEPDDFIISMRSFQGGIEWCRLRGSTSFHYVMLTPVKWVWPPFFAYALKSAPYIEALRRTTDLIRDGQELRYSNFAQVPLPVVPMEEQKAIAAFLDREIGRIDRLIETQEKLLTLLAEKRQSTICQAILRGLNPSVPTKDSGVMHLGQVPVHWDILALKKLAILKSGEGITSEKISSTGEYPVFGGNGIRGFTSSFTHQGSFVLIGRQGALCGNVNYAQGKFWASEHAVVATPAKPVNTIWLGEMLRVMNLNRYSVSAAQPGLSVEVISNIQVPYPPLEEQHAIAALLCRETTKIDALVAEREKLADLLQERRSALIAAAVTGQIDVRGLVNPPESTVPEEVVPA